MAQTKALQIKTAQNPNLTTYAPGDAGNDTEVDNQWAQITANNGLMLDGVTVATTAYYYNGNAVFDLSGRCVNQPSSASSTFVAGLVPVQVITGATGSKAIAIPSVSRGIVRITKGSAAIDLTIAAPIAGTDDGKEIIIIDEGGHAHVITNSAIGFNGKGSSGTATYDGTKGTRLTVFCDGGKLWAAGTNVTIT